MFEAPSQDPAVVLAGPPGVGKSTTGSAVGRRLGWASYDLDQVVARRCGEAAGALLRRIGEGAFRALETEALSTLPPGAKVVALGGGTTCTTAGLRAARRLGVVVGLEASTPTLRTRLGTDGAIDRPLLGHGLEALLEGRRGRYAAVDRSLSAEGETDQVVARVTEAVSTVSVEHLSVGQATTRVVAGHGLAGSAGAAVAALAPSRPVQVFIDRGVPEAVAKPYLEAIAAQAALQVRVVAGGEGIKDWSEAGALLDSITREGGGRQSAIVALGGGATCDLAAFLASVLGRGAPVVLIPSTLLAQVDAAFGGKTALNLGAGRNLVGTFHPADTVVLDGDLLTSLPLAERRSGLAELFKIALISSPEFFRAVIAAGDATPALILQAVRAKAALVDQDPRDQGVRRHLNLGHTLGHALERASDYQVRHGEAVAIGLAAVTRFSAEQGWLAPEVAQEILAGLQGLGLPTHADRELLKAASAHLGADKKGSADRVHLITIHGLAKIAVHELSLDSAREGLVRNGGSR